VKVLIVDDEPDVRTFLQASIRILDCEQIDTAGSGEEALARAIQNRYDLVTLDIKMPGVSGIDILSVIRGLMPYGVIAIVSGHIEDMPDLAEDQVDLILSKPVRMDRIRELVALTRELTEKRKAIQALSERG